MMDVCHQGLEKKNKIYRKTCCFYAFTAGAFNETHSSLTFETCTEVTGLYENKPAGEQTCSHYTDVNVFSERFHKHDRNQFD